MFHPSSVNLDGLVVVFIIASIIWLANTVEYILVKVYTFISSMMFRARRNEGRKDARESCSDR